MTKRKLRVAQVMLSIQPGGGAETLALTFAQAAANKAIELHVISLRQRTPSLQAQIEATGATVVCIPGHRLPNPQRFWQLVGYLRKNKIDIIHSHLTGANILALLAGWLLKIPVVVSLHNVYKPESANPFHARLENWLLNNVASKVLAVGWLTAADHQARLPNCQIDVIPNAITMPKIVCSGRRQELRTEVMHNVENHLLLAVGRLVPQKAQQELLAAFAAAHKHIPTMELIIAGTGPLKDELMNQIAQLGLQNNVRLLGFRSDINELMAAADLFVSASHWEGLPVSMLEAMGSSLPLAITEVGDVGRVVTNEMAYLCSPAQPEQLAKAIQMALSQPEQTARMAAQAKAHAATNFGADHWVDTLLNCYYQLLPNSSG